MVTTASNPALASHELWTRGLSVRTGVMSPSRTGRETRACVTTYYELLGVQPDASVKEIRTAHRIRLQLVHPDKHQGAPGAVLSEAERQTQLLNEALAVLTNDQRRADYDASLVVVPVAMAAPK